MKFLLLKKELLCQIRIELGAAWDPLMIKQSSLCLTRVDLGLAIGGNGHFLLDIRCSLDSQNQNAIAAAMLTLIWMVFIFIEAKSIDQQEHQCIIALAVALTLVHDSIFLESEVFYAFIFR